MLEELSDEGKVLYTWDLLTISETYQPWKMRHDTQRFYGTMEFQAPATLRPCGSMDVSESVKEF